MAAASALGERRGLQPGLRPPHSRPAPVTRLSGGLVEGSWFRRGGLRPLLSNSPPGVPADHPLSSEGPGQETCSRPGMAWCLGSGVSGWTAISFGP